MFNRQLKVYDALILSVYILVGSLFLLALITSAYDWRFHLLLGYALSILLIPVVIYSMARFFTMFSLNQFSVIAPEAGIICRIFRVSTCILIVFTTMTGMIVLAYSEQIGPLYSVIDYFPYWVFVTVNELHKTSAHAALILFSFSMLSYLNERFLQKLSSNHSSSIIRKDH